LNVLLLHLETSLRKFRRCLLPLLSCCLLLFAFQAEAASNSTVPLKTISLQLKWKHQFQFAGYYAAVDQGYYRQAGLEVKILETSDSATPIERVLKGDVEFGIAMSDLALHRGGCPGRRSSNNLPAFAVSFSLPKRNGGRFNPLPER
jgi:ABC-type nitrate/sulfonate/bicarbonate transport system substrate-binding protein